ncbi:MAG: hypothetical protein QOF59_1158 [Actinomycetota bacterium]|nr:hypothetical protein [Actinomycetota bacterium]
MAQAVRLALIIALFVVAAASAILYVRHGHVSDGLFAVFMPVLAW